MGRAWMVAVTSGAAVGMVIACAASEPPESCKGPACNGVDASVDAEADTSSDAPGGSSDGSSDALDADANDSMPADVEAGAVDASNDAPDADLCGDPSVGTWKQLGGALSWIPGDTASSEPSLQLDSTDTPVIAWRERDAPGSSPLRVYVARWSGTDWKPIGGSLHGSPANTAADSPSLALRADGSPVVAWHELNTTSNDVDVWVQAWTSAAWAPLAQPLSALPASSPAFTPDLVVDVNDVPLVAWSEYTSNVGDVYAAMWNGSTWQILGSALSAAVGATSAEAPSLQVSPAAEPIVAWSEGAVGARKIYVAKFVGGNWSYVGAPQQNLTDARAPELAVTTSGELYLAWSEPEPHVRKWSGSAWLALGAEPPVPGGVAPQNLISLVVDGSGSALIAWSGVATATPLQGIYVQRWNGTSWTQLGSPLTNGAAQHPGNPSMELDACGRPVVAFEQLNSTGTTEVYVYRYEK